MIPRGRPDLGWRDLGSAMLGCLGGKAESELRHRIEYKWAAPKHGLACLSVRSGFDATLKTLDLPKGSKILVTAINLGDMFRVIEDHGLVPVPLDVDPERLNVRLGQIENAMDENTRAILVAHLFGSRMPLDGIVAGARRRGLVVFEDCAQAFDGSDYRGHPDSDVAMFSFGAIKTATAMGGAVLCYRDGELRAKVSNLINTQPRQPKLTYFRRLLRGAFLKTMTTRVGYSILYKTCKALGRNHDDWIRKAVRGFPASQLMRRIRHRPSLPLLRLLDRRLHASHTARIQQRVAYASKLAERMPNVTRPGSGAAHHAHWVFPVSSGDPDGLVKLLWSNGFDATRHGSSLSLAFAAGDPRGKHLHDSRQILDQLVYLPMRPNMSASDLDLLSLWVNEFEKPLVKSRSAHKLEDEGPRASLLAGRAVTAAGAKKDAAHTVVARDSKTQLVVKSEDTPTPQAK